MNRYIVKNGKKMRYGYTTGSCAAGVAKAGVEMLFSQERIDSVTIDTPKGWELNLKLQDVVIDESYVSCSIIKDSGDDPDITNKIKIYARVEKTNKNDIEITGGIGVGKVTKKGLAVPIGEYAINPVPMKMIREEVRKVLPNGRGVKITIYCPEGVEVSKKTFNPKLGIIGGISILGTSGIVEPMSEEAFKDSLAIELSILKEQGIKKIIFSPGNYGRDFARNLGLSQDALIKTSNFIGFMIDKAVEYNITEILWVGHIGKMIKVAGGTFHTHSKISDGRMEILAANCALHGGSQELIKKIMESNTTEESADYIKEENMEWIFPLLAEKISKKCEERGLDKLNVGTILFSQDQGLLGICPKGKELLEEFRNE